MYLSNPKRKKHRKKNRVTAVATVRKTRRTRRVRSRRVKRVGGKRRSHLSILKRGLYAVNPSRRRHRRSGGHSGRGMFGGLVSKEDILIAAGAVGAGVVTSQILTRIGGSLPGANTVYGGMIYRAGIPIAGAMLLKKYSPALAKGMVIGGFVTAINDVLTMVLAPKNTSPAAVAAYLGAYPGSSGAHNAVNLFSAMPGATPPMGGSDIYASTGAFTNNAWE